MENVPNPGSPEALAKGCLCPRMDNHYGRGIPYPRKDGLDPELHPSFYVNENCPLHASPPPDAEKTEGSGE